MANGLVKALGIIGVGALAGGAAAYFYEKKGNYSQAGYQTNDHFENEEAYEEPLDEEVATETEEDVTVTEF